MALPMVHLGAAQAALEKLEIQDLPAYYLGCIAPDGVHMQKEYTPEDKERSHLGTRTSRDAAAVGEFLKRLPEFPNRDYAVGYAVHVLTDILWGTEFMPGFEKRYKADPAPVQELTSAYYNDMDLIDLELYKILPGREQMWRELEQATAADLPGVLSGEAADLWNQRTRRWYLEPKEYPVPLRYMTLPQVRDFISRAGEYSADFILGCLGEQPD